MNRSKSRNNERGYILLTLIFFVAVLAIGLTVMLPSVIHEAKRDREEEMVHRGVQYARAIRLYYKKLGRYPAKIEDLESTNNLRFLRKRYKDPFSCPEPPTCDDFKLLRFGDPSVKMQGGIALLQPGQGVGGGAGGQNGGQNNAALLNAAQGLLQQQGGLGAPPQQNLNEPNPSDPNPSGPNAGSPSPSDPNQNPDKPAEDANGNPVVAGASADKASAANSSSNKPASGLGGQFGGGAIVGVASTSHQASIREYNKKHHYHEWQFLYDPAMDRGGLINTPAQPQLQGGGQFPQDLQGKQPGTPGQPGSQPGTPQSPQGGPNPQPIGDPQQ